MKISVKELRPNPFRDMPRYPIHRMKVEALKASIRATGFWDNILARKAPNGDGYEVAYGHHRLEALKELLSEHLLEPDYKVDAPIRNLDDAAMIRIMAGENLEEYHSSSEVVDETVRVTRDFIQRENKVPLHQISAADISEFLGGGWHEGKIKSSLTRIGLFDRGTVKREQFDGVPAPQTRSILREVASVERAVVREKLDAMEDGDGEITEDEKRKIRSRAKEIAGHVADALATHIRNGGSPGEAREKSIRAQAEMLPAPEEAPEDERKLSTIDAAARSINARELKRKVELLLKYSEFMSPGARHELTGTLRDLKGWCTQMITALEQTTGAAEAAPDDDDALMADASNGEVAYDESGEIIPAEGEALPEVDEHHDEETGEVIQGE